MEIVEMDKTFMMSNMKLIKMYFCECKVTDLANGWDIKGIKI